MMQGRSHLSILLVFVVLQLIEATPGCVERFYPGFDTNMVCVCNSTYCDVIEPLGTIAKGKAVLYQSTIDGKRMDKSTITISSAPTGKLFTYDATSLHQKVLGFGGAFTDATGINIISLPRAAQDLLMQQYFGPAGAEYTIGRVPIASTDFSLTQYSYADTPGDFNLTNFALQDADYSYKIPFIKQAMTLQKGSGGLKLFASPWSAPAWMKSNNAMQGGGRLRGFEGGPYYVTWANYFVKFLEAYHKEGIDYWSVTVQNEPTTGLDPKYKWQTMFFSAEMERDFIKGQLGPALRSNPVTKEVNIIILDDQRTIINEWADTILGDKEAASYTAGIGVHWYRDLIIPASELTTAHERHPTKFILATEACEGWIADLGEGIIMGDFSRAEDYAFSIIEDLNNFAGGWTDWNMALNPQGGPTYADNIVDSPIIVDAKEGVFMKQPMYYAITHFSKFLKPGASRTSLSVPSDMEVSALAALMVDGRRFLAVLNKNPTMEASISIADTQHPGEFISLNIPPRSINTIIWNK